MQLWPPGTTGLSDASVIDAVLRGEDVHTLLPRFVQIASLEAAAQVPIVAKRPLLSDERPQFVSLGAPHKMLTPSGENQFVVDCLKRRFERDWYFALIQHLHIVVIKTRGPVRKEAALTDKLLRLFPNATEPYFVQRHDRYRAFRTAVILLSNSTEAKACLKICEGRKTWRAEAWDRRLPTIQNVDVIPFRAMSEQLDRFAVYTFRFGATCTADVILHQGEVARSAYAD